MKPEFKEILNRADEIEARNKAWQIKQAEREAKKIKKKKYSQNVLTLRNYRSFRIKHIGILWFILGLSIPIPLFFIIPNRTVHLICYSMFGIFILRVLYHYVTLILGYIKFRSFFNNLSFPLNGWIELLNTDKFKKFQYWRETSIIINYKQEKDIPDNVKNALYTILIDKANSNFYTPESSYDPRKEWHKTDNNNLRGSLNSAVTGDFYLFLKNDLVPLNEKYDCIANIEIQIQSEPYEVEPIRVQSEGTAT
ncbi:MAG: hypothetical protein JXA68_01560 [Ignavibacteriales bacterium]|nr:hypothetical protein [Ignavibacteriales bacterium]